MGRESRALKTRKLRDNKEFLRFADAEEIVDYAKTYARLKALDMVPGRSSYSIVRLDDAKN